MATVSLASGMELRPTSVALATQDNYVSSLTTTALNMHKRDVSEDLVKRYGDQGITGLLELLGNKKECTQTQFEHYEEALMHNAVKLTMDGSAPSAAATAAETMTLVAEDNVDASGPDTILDGSVADHPVRQYDVILFHTGDMVLVTSDPVGTESLSIVVAPLTSWTGNLSASTTVRGAIVGNMHAEGTGQPGSILPRVHTYSNKCMIIKESFEVTGSEATNVVYFKVDNEHFGSGYLWYLKGEQDTFKRFQDYSEMMLLLGKQVTNTGVITNGSNGTEGLLPFVEDNGQSMDLGAASITMADWDAIVKSLDKYRGAKENALYAGINLSLDIDDLLASQGAYAAGGANYGTFNNSKDMALNLGFNSFNRGGYTFHKKTYDLFNHPKLLGVSETSTFNYPGYGIVIPMDSRRDAKSGDKIPSLRIRYKAVPGYSREMEHWLTGSAVLKNKTNATDSLLSHYRTERGFEGFAPNRFMLIKKS